MTELSSQPWLHAASTQHLLKAFAAAGEELRFVGGCVRDAVMGRPVKDIDAATPATPDRVMVLLESAGIKSVPTGLAHGTITAVIDRHPFEITTLRTDNACDGRWALVTYTDDWQADAARRDFTMNALYCDAAGQLTDFFGGVEDAKAGRIVFIGEAADRIREDALRILRFFRFFATHGRPPANEAALTACTAHADMIAALSGERIQHEMLKLLGTADPSPALKLMRQCDVLAQVIPVSQLPDSLQRFTSSIADQPPDNRYAAFIRLALLLRATDEPQHAAAQLASRWKLSNRDKRILYMLVSTPAQATPDDAAIVKSLRARGREMTRLLLLRDHAEQGKKTDAITGLLHQADTLPIPEFPLTGDDLLRAGTEPGRAVGKALKALEDYWEAHGYKPGKDDLLAVISTL